MPLTKHIDQEADFFYFSKTKPEDTVVLKLNLHTFPSPLYFNVSTEDAELILINHNTKSNDFIWIETTDNKMFYVNKSHIKELTTLDKNTLDNPDTKPFPKNQTPLMNADTSQSTILSLLHSNLISRNDQDIHTDAQWLIKHQCSIAQDITAAEPSTNTLLSKSWGVRLYTYGQTEDLDPETNTRITTPDEHDDLFIPGMAIRKENWDKSFAGIKNLKINQKQPSIAFKDNLGFGFKLDANEIILVEYPSLFNAMHDIMHYNTSTMQNTH